MTLQKQYASVIVIVIFINLTPYSLGLCITTNVVAAQNNPASVDYVNHAIATATAATKTYVDQSIAALPTLTQSEVNQAIVAAMTLSQADWQAVCQNGNINSTTGCYGDAGSDTFAKINRLGGNPLGYAGVTGSAANSVWVRQIGTGTSCTTTNAQLSIINTAGVANSTIWICGVELTNGSPVSYSAGLGALVTNAAVGPGSNQVGILYTTIASSNMSAGGTTALTSGQLYFTGSTILPTAYAFCISTTNTSVATAFAQAPGASFNSNPAC